MSHALVDTVDGNSGACWQAVGNLLKRCARDRARDIATNIGALCLSVENILNNRLLGWPSIATIVSITSAANSQDKQNKNSDEDLKAGMAMLAPNLLVLLILLNNLLLSNLEEASVFCRRDELAGHTCRIKWIIGTIASCLKEGISLRWLARSHCSNSLASCIKSRLLLIRQNKAAVCSSVGKSVNCLRHAISCNVCKAKICIDLIGIIQRISKIKSSTICLNCINRPVQTHEACA